MVISEQFQHIHVAEALINYDIRFDLDIRRRGVDAFTLQLPADYRVISVDGANIAKWDLPASQPAAPQILTVKLFARQGQVHAEREDGAVPQGIDGQALADAGAGPAGALRGTGLIALTHASSRSVEVADPKNLARVDVGSLPDDIRRPAGRDRLPVHRRRLFRHARYRGRSPANHALSAMGLGVGTDALTLKGQLSYHVERSGLFQVTMDLPQAWEIVSVGPDAVVEDHQLAGTGDHRELTILLKKETLGDFTVEWPFAPQSAPDAPVDFALPLPAAQDLQLYTGQLWLMLPDQLKAEVDKLDQLAAMPTGGGACWTAIDQMRPAMAFEFKAVDRAKPAGAKFKITVKPTQISATVSRLVNIEQGSLQQEAVVQYQILYAPVDTLYVQVPAALADTAEISGENIKEKVRLTELPADQRPQATSSPATAPSGPSGADAPVYYKIVLQSPVIGPYTLRVNCASPSRPPGPASR